MSEDREMFPTILGRAIREDGREFRQGDMILLDQSCYNSAPEPQWSPVVSIAPGTASVYPIKYSVAGHVNHTGQAKPSEIIEVKRPERALEAEAFFGAMGGVPHWESMTLDVFFGNAPLGELDWQRERRTAGERPSDD